jgi:hypothetical protein
VAVSPINGSCFFIKQHEVAPRPTYVPSRVGLIIVVEQVHYWYQGRLGRVGALWAHAERAAVNLHQGAAHAHSQKSRKDAPPE